MRRSIFSMFMLAVVFVLSGIVVIAQDDVAQTNKQAYLDAIAEYNAGNREAFYSLFANPFMMNQGKPVLAEMTVEDVIGYEDALVGAMPDLQNTSDIVIAQGEWLAVHVVYTGTFTEPLYFGPEPIAPTNAAIRWTETNFLHFNADGLIDAAWNIADPSILFGQLGVFPAMDDGGSAGTLLELPAGYQALSADEFAASLASDHEVRNVGIVEEMSASGIAGYVPTAQYFADPFITWSNGQAYSLSISVAEEDAPFVNALAQALPDNTITADVVVAEGDWVAALRTFSGTFSEDFDFMYFDAPLPHTDETITWQQAYIYRFDNDGKIVEGWSQGDQSPLFMALMPPMEDE